MLPSLRLILMVAAAAPLFFAGSFYAFSTGLGVVYVFLLLLYCIFDAWILPKPDTIRIKRIMPERLSLGHPAEILIEIENPGKRNLHISLVEMLPPEFEMTPAVCQALLIKGERKTLTYRLTAFKRGNYTIDGMTVRLLPAMGLFYRQFTFETAAEIQVYPNLVDIKRYELINRRGRNFEQGIARLRMMGKGAVFESLRQYVPGDETSCIDWKASAKRAKLIVKNYEPERRQNILVALDVGRATAGHIGSLSRVDYLVNATMMLAYTTLCQKDWFSVVAFSDRIESYLPPISGIKNLDRVAKALFQLQPRLVESDYAAACRFIGLKNRKRSLLCLMTDVISQEASHILISYLARFARHHLLLAVTLSDPEMVKVADEPLETCTDPYSKAVAIDSLFVRKKALKLMRQKGISVLDVPPEKLTPALINRYAIIKSQRRL